jgi:hypothetical protein
LLDLYTIAVIAEVKRQVSIAPDILLNYYIRLRFDLYFVGMIVAPSDAVVSTNRALAYIDIFRELGNCDNDGAVVVARADRDVYYRYIVLYCLSWSMSDGV